MRRTAQALLVLAFILTGSAGVAADYPAPKEGSWGVRDFKFHTGDGNKRPLSRSARDFRRADFRVAD